MNNILCQYKGGGYDGCHWEWNFFVLDKQGKFHDIYSSGVSGIKKQEDALEKVKDEEDNSLYIYDLSNERDIKDFQEECNEGHVIEVTNAVNDLINKGIKIDSLWWFCDCCGKRVGFGNAEDYVRCGGIAMQATKKCCDDCYHASFFDEYE